MTPAVLVLVALSLMLFHRLDVLPVEKIRMAVTDVMVPLMKTVSEPFVAMTESFNGVVTLRQLRAENMRLKEENSKSGTKTPCGFRLKTRRFATF